MQFKAFLVLLGAVLLAAPNFFPPGAHCPSSVPAVKMQYPSEGVAIQEACYAEYTTCFVDTFYVSKLKQELVDLYKANKYAVFAYMDSVSNFENYDTTFYHGEINFIDTFTNERLVVGIHTNLKDSLPVKKLTFIDRWIAFTNNPFATTYVPLLDTPFVAFFNQYDSIKKMGIGPMDGCFFEPTVFQIHGNRIHKKGLVGSRMAGVSVTMEEFFQAIGHDPVPVPPVGVVRPRSPGKVALPRRDGFRYDLNGRRLGSRMGRAWTYSRWGVPILASPGPTSEISSDGVSQTR